MKPAVGLKDGLLLLVSGAFTVAGVSMLVAGRGNRAPIAVTAFFGMCTCIAAWIIVEKHRMARSSTATRVEVAGGVAIPARQSIRWIAGAGLALVGSIMAWGGEEIGGMFQALSVFIAGVGVVLLVLLALGRVGGQTLTFEPEGLRFGDRRGSYLVRWTNFASVQVIDYQSNPAFVAAVRDVSEVAASAGGPGSAAAARTTKGLAKNRAWTGWDIFILPYHFGIDAVLFEKAVRGYVEDPSRRAALARSRLSSGDDRSF